MTVATYKVESGIPIPGKYPLASMETRKMLSSEILDLREVFA